MSVQWNRHPPLSAFCPQIFQKGFETKEFMQRLKLVASKPNEMSQTSNFPQYILISNTQ